MKYLLLLIIILFLGCSKPKSEQPATTYSVTYTFKSDAPAYFVDIWSPYGSAFSDSIYTPTFSKTIVYTYKDNRRAMLTNRNTKPSYKRIDVNSDGVKTYVEDSWYGQLIY